MTNTMTYEQLVRELAAASLNAECRGEGFEEVEERIEQAAKTYPTIADDVADECAAIVCGF